jgi:hypothetical protein
MTSSSHSTSPHRPPMNRYGAMAWEQWERHRPAELAKMTDPVTEFTNLGNLIASEIDIETTTRLTANPTLEPDLVRTEVTEIVLHEMIWSQTERDSSDWTSSEERDETLIEEIPIAFDDTTNLARWARSPLTQSPLTNPTRPSRPGG